MLAALEAAIASLHILGAPGMPQQARRPTVFVAPVRGCPCPCVACRVLQPACRGGPRFPCL